MWVTPYALRQATESHSSRLPGLFPMLPLTATTFVSILLRFHGIYSTWSRCLTGDIGKMRALSLSIFALLSVSAHAALLTDASTFINATVVDDWSTVPEGNGLDGPPDFDVYQGLRIESLNNDSPNPTYIGHYPASPGTGLPDDADGSVSALNAKTYQTDLLFVFPGNLRRAGFYIRGIGTYKVEALDISRSVLDSDLVVLSRDNGTVAFRGFEGLPSLRSIRVNQLFRGSYSTQFDEVQWLRVPEPSSYGLLVIGVVALRRRRR